MAELIPAIDLLEGKVVRLKVGDYKQVTEYGEPAEFAKYWLDQGVRRLHVVDLDGAKIGKPVNLKGLEQILSTGIQVQFGGGIRKWESLEELFELGVRHAILGTAAIKEKEFMIRALNIYKERILLSLDSRGGKVSLEGWLEDTNITTFELLEDLQRYGLSRFIYTDITRDGTMNGPDISGAVELCLKFPSMKCIISGGVSSLQDLKDIKSQSAAIDNLEGIISGRALYEDAFSFADAKEILDAKI
ncbi:MAG TPA: 1-(5-phosphoribosyl)-5-[(5-phosphoribosylamino)methylideneamino]imidazole-4-carboxamide isomerase [Vampirovibrionales bacterium]